MGSKKTTFFKKQNKKLVIFINSQNIGKHKFPFRQTTSSNGETYMRKKWKKATKHIFIGNIGRPA